MLGFPKIQFFFFFKYKNVYFDNGLKYSNTDRYIYLNGNFLRKKIIKNFRFKNSKWQPFKLFIEKTFK